MKLSSTDKILKLLNLLLENDYTKNDIVQEFQKLNIKINKPTINKYIESLKENKFEIQTLREKNENLYHLQKSNENIFFEITPKEMLAINDIKKLLIAQKEYSYIRNAMRVFYKFAKYIKDEETKADFINFGYYSIINWKLVRQLEKHCKTKDVIELEYILPQGESKNIIFHVDCIQISDTSEKLYLHGTFEKANQFSYLPIDRIFGIKRVIRKYKYFRIPVDIVEYKISKELFNEIELDDKETATFIDENYVMIQRPIENSFYLIQRLLYFCPDLYYISDENIKNSVKEKLCTIKSYYDNKLDK